VGGVQVGQILLEINAQDQMGGAGDLYQESKSRKKVKAYVVYSNAEHGQERAEEKGRKKKRRRSIGANHDKGRLSRDKESCTTLRRTTSNKENQKQHQEGKKERVDCGGRKEPVMLSTGKGEEKGKCFTSLHGRRGEKENMARRKKRKRRTGEFSHATAGKEKSPDFGGTTFTDAKNFFLSGVQTSEEKKRIKTHGIVGKSVFDRIRDKSPSA